MKENIPRSKRGRWVGMRTVSVHCTCQPRTNIVELKFIIMCVLCILRSNKTAISDYKSLLYFVVYFPDASISNGPANLLFIIHAM